MLSHFLDVFNKKQPAKINVLGIDHIAINCNELEKSRDFYENVFGLKLSKREHQKPGMEYFLDCGNSLLGLIQGDPEKGEHLLKHEGIGGNHFSFRIATQDFDIAVEELKKRDIPVEFFKKREKSWSVYFYDPDGNKLEMTAWPEEDQSPAYKEENE